MEEQQPILKSSESKKGGRDGELVELQHNPFSSSSPAPYQVDEAPPSAAPSTAGVVDDPLSASKALVLVNSIHNDAEQSESVNDGSPMCNNVSFTPGSLNREIVLAKLNQEKVLSLIKAWEDNVKAKSLHRFGKKLSKISAWEKAKKARAEAHLHSLEEKLENKRATIVESVQNEIATVHKKAEEERALAEANHGEETLKAEEVAAKYRASGKFPRKYALCFGV